MELKEDPTTNATHGSTLLRELNSQRRMGQFCDCVIQLHSHPGKLFLAHKSVLAAFSPVLASLLPHHGTLMDLNVPCLTPETLDNLLEYIYTGSLPPQSQEESVLSSAFYLRMDELQQALKCREKATRELTVPVQDKLSQKRRFVDRQSLDENPPVSPSHYQYGSDRPPPSSPTYEVVPVIRHSRASGNDKPPPQSHWGNRHDALDAEYGGRLVHSEEHSQHGDPQSIEKSFLLDHFSETSHSKQDNVLTDLQRVVSEEVEGRSGESGRLRSILSEKASDNTSDLRSNTDNKDQCVETAHTTINAIAPSTECHQTSNRSCPQFNRCASSGNSRCVLDIDSHTSFNTFDSGKGDHLVKMFSEAFNDKNLYNITGTGSSDGSHCCGQFARKYDDDIPSCLENSSSTDTSEMMCEKGTSHEDVWSEVSHAYAHKPTIESKPSETGKRETNVVEENFKSIEHAENYELSITRRNDGGVYQGQVRYHCLLERPHAAADSSDSDSERACTLPDRREPLEAEPALGQHSKPRPFQCSLCERPFSQRGSLNRHVRSHLGVRPYSCPRCAMTFSRQYRVTEHMRVHLRNYEGLSPGHPRVDNMQVDV